MLIDEILINMNLKKGKVSGALLRKNAQVFVYLQPCNRRLNQNFKPVNALVYSSPLQGVFAWLCLGDLTMRLRQKAGDCLTNYR